MKDKNLQITVVGPTNSGKSRICYVIKEALKSHGIDVLFDGGMDFLNEREFNVHMKPNLEEALKAISERTNVSLYEIQTVELTKTEDK